MLSFCGASSLAESTKNFKTPRKVNDYKKKTEKTRVLYAVPLFFKIYFWDNNLHEVKARRSAFAQGESCQ